MAGEVGHVVYGARLLHYLGDKVQDPSYWAGTLFPDIRHFGIVSRKRTHIDEVTLNSLAGKDDFETGMRVHAWVDATRERYLHDRHIKETLPWHPFVPHALKLVEDEILYDVFEDWNLVHRVLGNVYDAEIEFVSSSEEIKRWHTILQKYFQKRPDDMARTELSISIGLSENSAAEVNSVVATLKESKKARDIITSFLHHLEDILR